MTLASLVVRARLKIVPASCTYCSFFVRQSAITDDIFPAAVIELPPNWKVYRLRAFPFVKFYCERQTGTQAAIAPAEDALLSGVKVATLGLPALIYGLGASAFFKSTVVAAGVECRHFYDANVYEAGFRSR